MKKAWDWTTASITDRTPPCIEGWYGYREKPCPSQPESKEVTAIPTSLEYEDKLYALRQENRELSSRVRDLERQLEQQVTARDKELVGLRKDRSIEQAGAKQRIADLERQLAARDEELAGLRRDLINEQAEAKSQNITGNQQVTDLERQLAARDQELAGLQSELSTELAKLQEAQRGLIRELRPEIEKGDITVDLNNERLLIKLASNYLFGSGEDQLKPAGADALNQVGAILKEYPKYKVAVEGHTDNRPIRSALLKKKFPTNLELSEARAASAAEALREGGLSNVTTAGFSDTKPVAPNSTDAGRAKNRRVEVRVTK